MPDEVRRPWPLRLVNKFLHLTGLPGRHFLYGPYLDVDGAVIFPEQNAHMLSVAPGVAVQDAYFNLQAPVTIDEGVVLGHQVMFATGKHEVTPDGVDMATGARGPIHVKRRAWLASRCLILGGVTIGEGAVVGAGAVVTKSVPDHEFWAGNPAKFIRRIGDEDPNLGELPSE